MRKVFIPAIILLFLTIIMFVVFTKASETPLTKDQAIIIGEEKYLQFLWMVDGAFNNQEEFIVNNKKIPEENKVFHCKYKNKSSKECVGENFEEEFSKLFSHDIKYDNVYSDDIMYNWHRFENGDHIFSMIDSCNVNRMPINHKLELVNISSNKLEFKVSFINRQTEIVNNRDFILVLEDGIWKINTAFYYDNCENKYYIY